MTLTLVQVHDACLRELSLPRSLRLTLAQYATLRARLRYIIQYGGRDPVLAGRLFSEAMDGV